MEPAAVTRALISVSEKSGIAEFAHKLAGLGIEILSTGGTSKLLIDKGVPVRSVDSYTGFSEIMDGRVKTLHPKIHGGILAVRDNATHKSQMDTNGIIPIDMVVVNLYPFKQTIARKDVTLAEAIENIDIGGPAMIRSAAKNHGYVTVVVDAADYAEIIQELEEKKATSYELRKRLAVKAFRHTSEYDSAICDYLAKVFG